MHWVGADILSKYHYKKIHVLFSFYAKNMSCVVHLMYFIYLLTFCVLFPMFIYDNVL